MRILSAADVTAALPMAECVEVMAAWTAIRESPSCSTAGPVHRSPSSTRRRSPRFARPRSPRWRREILANETAVTLAIIGAGVQAEAHLKVIPLVRAISSARVFSPRSAPALVERMNVPFDLTVAASAEEAVRGTSLNA